MQPKVRMLILIGVFLGLLLGVQVMSTVHTHADRGAWAVGMVYAVNDTVTYDGSTYRCTQTHVSQDKWTPAVTMTMWQPVLDGAPTP